MLTNETFLLETATSSKLISKAPKCTIESFQLLLGAIDYINDNGGQDTFPKLLFYDDTLINNNTTTTEELSNSNSIEEDNIPPSLTISDESEDKSSEDEQSPATITTPKSKQISNSNSKHSNSIANGKSRAGHHNRNNGDDSNLICSCCKRDSSAVSFLKNYSIHSGNIDNYRNTFPDYDVVPGVSCMTCYHKSWRYSKGLYDPNKARGAINKREGIQKSPSPASTSTRKKSSPKRKSNAISGGVATEQESEVNNSSEEILKSSTSSASSSSNNSKPRKISKRRQNSSPSSSSTHSELNQNEYFEEMKTTTQGNSESFTTSTFENSQGLHHSLRLLLKFVWIDQGDDGEVYSCPINLDFAPTTLTSIKSLVIGKLKSKLSGYECDSIIWCHDNQKTLLTDTELQQKALRNDDMLIVNVK